MGVTFGKTSKHNGNLKALDYVLLIMSLLSVFCQVKVFKPVNVKKSLVVLNPTL